MLIVKLLDGETDAPDAPDLLSLLIVRAPIRSLRDATLLQPNLHHNTVYEYYEPISECIRAFTAVEELFELNESLGSFAKRIKTVPN